MYVGALSACMSEHQRNACDPIIDGCEAPRGSWELSSGPLNAELFKHLVLLTAEPSPQPLQSVFPYLVPHYVRSTQCGFVLPFIFDSPSRHIYNSQ